MTQLADLIEKAKNGKRTKDIFSRLSSQAILNETKVDETKDNINNLEEQIAILDRLIFSNSEFHRANSDKVIDALEDIAQTL